MQENKRMYGDIIQTVEVLFYCINIQQFYAKMF